MTRKESIAAACRIDGWLTEAEAGLLYDLAHNANGPIVEIGSWNGRSTVALALGSMAGHKHTVYAVDPFIGPQEGARATSLKNNPEYIACSPEKLRGNLESVGINGTVKIVPKKSEEALVDVPEECSLIFIDGDHSYEAVCRDLENYLPRLKLGGMAVLHDVGTIDRGVVQAIDTCILTKPNQYRVLDRVDSAMVLRRVDTQRRTVALACPGGNFAWGTVTGIVQSTLGAHRIDLDNNGNGWDDFNALWARALNRAELGEITHFAMLHSDVVPSPGWVDILMDEMEALDADLISVACAMKDGRGCLNCGLSHPSNRWGAFRRLTVRELLKLPATFDLDTLQKSMGLADKILLHNTGCFVCDLRKPVFYQQTDANEYLKAWFNFPTRVRRDKESGLWTHDRESEDWFFSRELHELGARTFITRKVKLAHYGHSYFTNYEPWGTFENGDEDTKALWEKELQGEKA